MNSIILESYKKNYYPSVDKLFIILKKDYPNISRKLIKSVIDSQLSHQLHKKQTDKIHGHMTAYNQNEKWIMDLSDMSNFSTTNKGYKWILFIIDVFTRKLMSMSLKNKKSDTVLNAFITIVKKNGNPNVVISDNGNEFVNNDFKKYLMDNNIHQQTSEPGYHKTLGLIDRVTRTIKEKMTKLWTDNNTTNWIDNIDSIVENYNNSPHKSLKNKAPNDISKFDNTIESINISKNVNIENQHDFKIGDTVRKKLKKTIFTKGYKQIWSFSTYTIKQINGANATLNNDTIVKLNDLQKINNDNGESKTHETTNEKFVVEIPKLQKDNENHIFESNDIEKKAKHAKLLKSLDINKSNIIEKKRIRVVRRRDVAAKTKNGKTPMEFI